MSNSLLAILTHFETMATVRILSRRRWLKIVMASLALPLLLTFILPAAVPAQAIIKIEDIDPDNIITGTVNLRLLQGNDDENLIIGSVLDDAAFGEGGKDIIYTADSPDQAFGGPGDDLVNVGPGTDYAEGNSGDDVLIGGAGEDILIGGDGNDQIFGSPDDDTLEGDDGADAFDCGEGIDTIIDFNPSEGDTKSADCEIFSQNVPATGIPQQ